MQSVLSRSAGLCRVAAPTPRPSSCRRLTSSCVQSPRLFWPQLRVSRGAVRLQARTIRLQARHQDRCGELDAAPRNSSSSSSSAALPESSPYLEPFLRTFVLGVGAGIILEAGHVAAQVLSGSLPQVSRGSLAADHITGFALWMALYALEAKSVRSVVQRFGADVQGASEELRRLTTLPKRMLPVRMNLFKRLVLAASKLRSPARPAAAAAGPAAAATTLPFAADAALSSASESELSDAEAEASPLATLAAQQEAPTAQPQVLPRTSQPLPKSAQSSIAPAPGLLRRPRAPPSPQPPQQQDPPRGLGSAGVAKRLKELQDRESYLKNFWYAAALSSNVGDKPVKVELCGRTMVLFRGKDGRVRCVDNVCPHRGAPLSDGWVSEREGHDCIVCPYHGWAFDEHGTIQDVPAAVHKGEWPRRQLLDAYDVEEKGGFVWVFFGSRALPASERPPIPYVPELDDPSWKCAYEEIEFDCNHFGVFENAIDMAHIHYLHDFGNSSKPEIRDMKATTHEWGVTATFTIHNKPVNPFWGLFETPAVHVTAHAFLPSSSVVTFTLGNGLSFTTFVNTVPISANKTVNRFALVRNLAWDKSGLFNAKLWDGMARRAMMKIQLEDKTMVEQLKYDQLPAEFSVAADLPQVHFRKLRQQFVDLGYGVPPETVVPPFAASVARCNQQCD